MGERDEEKINTTIEERAEERKREQKRERERYINRRMGGRLRVAGTRDVAKFWCQKKGDTKKMIRELFARPHRIIGHS